MPAAPRFIIPAPFFFPLVGTGFCARRPPPFLIDRVECIPRWRSAPLRRRGIDFREHALPRRSLDLDGARRPAYGVLLGKAIVISFAAVTALGKAARQRAAVARDL